MTARAAGVRAGKSPSRTFCQKTRRFLAPALAVCLAAGAWANGYTTLEGHGGPVMGLAVGADGTVASASFDNAVGLWRDGASPRWLDAHDAAVNVVSFLPDGGLASGGDDFAVIRWEAETLGPTRLEGHQGKVMGLAASPDLLVSASWDGTIGLWPAAGGAPRFLEGHDGPVNTVALSGDGATLYSGAQDGTLRVWDAAGGAQERVLVSHGFGINELVLRDDLGWIAYGAVDGVTRVIGLDGAPLADLSLERRPILALAASPAGDRLAVGDGEGYIMVVDTQGWQIVRDFRAATHGPIWALAFSPDGATLYAAGLDTAVHAWPMDALPKTATMETGNESFLADPATMSNGERQFQRKCSICHTLTPGSARRAGPSLHALFGRRAGTVSDYRYSEALDGSDLIWTEDTVAALFEIGPAHYVPGTKMPMQRITGAEDRADLIDYLRRATAPEETRK